MIKKILIISTLLCLTSCLTNFLWGARTYREEITQFYVGSDGRYVVLMGPQYHYVFSDNSGILKEVVALQKGGSLALASDTTLELDSNNNVSGEVVLNGNADLISAQDAFKLQSLGFIPNSRNDIKVKMKLQGRRYSARYLSGVSSEAVKRYYITINYREDAGVVGSVGKAAITPVAMTLDAALLIGKVVIYPFTLPYKQIGID